MTRSQIESGAKSPRTALVTGGAGGIGRGICDAFVAANWRVVVHHEPSDHEAEAFIDAIRSNGGTATGVAADLADARSITRLFDELDRTVGVPKVLINNAGWDPGNVPLRDIDDEFLDRLFAVNIKAPMLMTQQAADRWIAADCRGVVVNVSSVHSTHSLAGRCAYATSKGALEAMTRQLAVELGPWGVRVNAVAPGFVTVPRTLADKTPEQLTSFVDRVPIGRLADPSDIASVVLYLASDLSGYITGQVLTVDGGTTCRLHHDTKKVARGKAHA
ncbi:MAG: glucose 1-dehydrogenase [Planctomycetota bacterium]